MVIAEKVIKKKIHILKCDKTILSVVEKIMIKSRLTGNGLKNRNQYNKHDNMYSICFFICDTKFHSLKKRDYSEGYALCESIILIFLFSFS